MLTKDVKDDLALKTGLTHEQIKRLVKHQRSKMYFNEFLTKY